MFTGSGLAGRRVGTILSNAARAGRIQNFVADQMQQTFLRGQSVSRAGSSRSADSHVRASLASGSVRPDKAVLFHCFLNSL